MTINYLYKDLFDRAKSGKISPEETELVASKLPTASVWDRYTLLHMLGLGGEQILFRGGTLPSHYRPLVEHFLQGPDESLAKLSLWILGRWWGLAGEYIDEIKKFMRGVAWDTREARHAAILIAGEYLHSFPEANLLRQLIDIFDHQEYDPDDRKYAYYALADALGRDLRRFPQWYDDLDLESLPESNVLPEARERLTKEAAYS